MHPTNERRRYNVTSLIGWVHAQNDPWDKICVEPIEHQFREALSSPWVGKEEDDHKPRQNQPTMASTSIDAQPTMASTSIDAEQANAPTSPTIATSPPPNCLSL